MKAKVERINKQKAIELLKGNSENRKVKNNLVEYLTHQMSSGLWKQNGESIIIDKNGQIKDGQHRLKAIVEANFSDYFVIAYDVNPDVFETIDTGKVRGLKDILYINGYKNEGQLAGTIRAIYAVEFDISIFSATNNKAPLRVTSSVSFSETGGKVHGNNEKYTFFKKHENYIKDIASESDSLYGKQNINILGPTAISAMIHRLRNFSTGKCTQITEFMEEVIGYNSEDGSAPNFLYKRLLDQKIKKEVKYSSRYINIVFARAWNDYQIGASVRIYQIKNKTAIPDIDRSYQIYE